MSSNTIESYLETQFSKIKSVLIMTLQYKYALLFIGLIFTFSGYFGWGFMNLGMSFLLFNTFAPIQGIYGFQWAKVPDSLDEFTPIPKIVFKFAGMNADKELEEYEIEAVKKKFQTGEAGKQLKKILKFRGGKLTSYDFVNLALIRHRIDGVAHLFD